MQFSGFFRTHTEYTLYHNTKKTGYKENKKNSDTRHVQHHCLNITIFLSCIMGIFFNKSTQRFKTKEYKIQVTSVENTKMVSFEHYILLQITT